MESIEAARSLAGVRAAVLETLSPRACAALRTALEHYVLDVGQYEASVRRAASGALRGGRVMIERAHPAVAEAAYAALEIGVPHLAHRLTAAAAAAEMPLIAGWDLREGEPCAKLYLNASDASEPTRRALREALGIPASQPAIEAPAVIGINTRRGGATELKLYAQARDALALARSLGPAARALAERAAAEGAAASGVASWDVDEDGARPRAFFVALREPEPSRAWRAITDLPGWDESAARRAMPFAPGPPRSVGVAVESAGTWTVYVKPSTGDRPPHTLVPTAAFRAGAVEVGVFVEPNRATQRAYARTDHHAISVRPREGRADRAALTSLLAWVTDRVGAAERAGHSPEQLLHDPPSPWRRVHD